MGATPSEKGTVLRGELGERHPFVEACGETVGWREAVREADLAGVVEIDQAGVERGIEMSGQ